MKRIIHTIITLAVSLASAHAQISDEIKPNVSDVSVSKSAGYDVIKLSGANHVTNQVGMPELPVISKTNKQSLTHGENAWHDTATR